MPAQLKTFHFWFIFAVICIYAVKRNFAFVGTTAAVVDTVDLVLTLTGYQLGVRWIPPTSGAAAAVEGAARRG